jgi:hypothetical protein
MTQDGKSTALSALESVVAFDRSLISEPARIRAALLDVATRDEIGVELVVISVRLGVPQLVTDGDATAAQLKLVDSAGVRVDIARGLVAAWQIALGIDPGDGSRSADGELYGDIRAVAPTIALGVLGPADCHVWADGGVSVLVLGMDGLALTPLETPIRGGPVTWHAIATPNAPVSRAAIMARVTSATSTIIWTDNSGLWSRPVRRSTPGRSVEIGDARIIDTPDAGQARYPIAALAVDGREIDMFWTADRRELLVSTRNGLGEIERRTVPSPCEPPERLAALDCAVASETTAWIAVLTDRGRLLLARWDIPSGEQDGWRVVICPVSGLTAMTVVMLSAGASIIVSDSHGEIGSADAATAYAGSAHWRNLALPTSSGNLTGLSSLAASSHGDLAWAVATTDDSVHLIRLQRYAEVTEALECLVIR